jgi:hypothetical protein
LSSEPLCLFLIPAFFLRGRLFLVELANALLLLLDRAASTPVRRRNQSDVRRRIDGGGGLLICPTMA